MGKQKKIRGSSRMNQSPAAGRQTEPGKVNRKLLHMAAFFFVSAGIVCGIYSNTIRAPFLFDDLPNITNNVFIRLNDLTFQGLMDVGFNSICSNRPVANISFALNYYLDGYDVAGYHAVNIAIHLAGTLLLFLLLKMTLELCRGRGTGGLIMPEHMEPWLAASAAAIVWAVHPTHTQSVTYLVQRMVSMASMFYLLSMVLYIRGRIMAGSWKWALYGGSALSGLLAVGSKEIALTLPFFIFLYEWYFFQDLDKAWLKKQTIRFSLALVVVLVLVLAYSKFSNPFNVLSGYSSREFTLGQRVLTEFRVVMHYIGLIALPHPSRLILDYDFPLSYSPIRPVTTLLSMVTILGLLACAVFVAKKDKLVSFAILWFFGNLVTESSIIPLELIYEHRIYLPSMFVIPIAVFAIIRYARPRWAHVAIIGLLVAVFSFWTYERNAVWADEIAFWKDNVEKMPTRARARQNYGEALSRAERHDEAIIQSEEAVRLAPEDHRTLNCLGAVYLRSGKADKALSFLTKAMELDPLYVETYNNRGKALMQLNRLNEAIVDLRKAVSLHPNFYEAHNNLGAAYMELGEYQKSAVAFSRAVELNPGSIEGHYNLGILYIRLGMDSEASRAFSQVVTLNPDVEAAHLILADILQKSGDREGALRHLRQALRINPGNLRVRQALEGTGAGSPGID